jgi:hypothetical protein
MSIKEEYVYVLYNPVMFELVKIGRTTKHPEIRANEITTCPAVLGKFYVMWFIQVPNSTMGEQIAFDKLRQYRCQKNRELFKIEWQKAVEIIQQPIVDYFKIGKLKTFERDNFSSDFTEYKDNQIKLSLYSPQTQTNNPKLIEGLRTEISVLQLELQDARMQIMRNDNLYIERIWNEATEESKIRVEKWLGSNKDEKDFQTVSGYGYIKPNKFNDFFKTVCSIDYVEENIYMDDTDKTIKGFFLPLPYKSYELKSLYAETMKEIFRKYYVPFTFVINGVNQESNKINKNK